MGENKEQIIYVCVAGCRDYHNYAVVSEYLDYVLQNLKKQGTICIVNGGAPGVDKLGILYSLRHKGFIHKEFFARWDLYNKSAGPRRNREMVDFLQKQEKAYVVAFWDGRSRGTYSLICEAQKANLPLKIKHINK